MTEFTLPVEFNSVGLDRHTGRIGFKLPNDFELDVQLRLSDGQPTLFDDLEDVTLGATVRLRGSVSLALEDYDDLGETIERLQELSKRKGEIVLERVIRPAKINAAGDGEKPHEDATAGADRPHGTPVMDGLAKAAQRSLVDACGITQKQADTLAAEANVANVGDLFRRAKGQPQWQAVLGGIRGISQACVRKLADYIDGNQQGGEA